ncbi:hypothetical protein PBY51_016609 [Eleginops maclovinus]|uniref:Protein Shroom2 n=1 Tax=Eleginops maclovinus TaxID=56733 RepID=A0AAN7WL97_ELEMC|nr:hypothetical protein PBY51_016609 [Eleginops maclovinus]
MVDVVSQRTMPSESEVHVARSFLTKILRSSMRKSRFKGKNDPGSRPQSWHSSKLTDVEPQSGGREDSTAPVWQPNHEARPKDSSTVNSMERPSHPPPLAGRLSPTKTSAESLCGPGSKKDSGFSCFSSNPSPPFNDPGTCERKGTSTENIFFKGPPSERPPPRYLQPTLGNGGWEGSRGEEPPASRVSVAGRPGMGPVWQVPEKKKSQSPPPPPPPLRSDSFAATKVFPYSEAKTHGRSFEKLTENNNHNGLRSHQEKTTEARRSLNPLPTKDFLHPDTASDHNHNQLHPNKLFSLSSNDVRQSHYTHTPAHQRQYSDESPLYLQKRSAPPTKIQSVGSYYRSLQDLPTRAFSRKHVRHSTASVANPNLENGWRHRYYGLAGKHPVQAAELQARQGKAEGWRGETEKPHRVNSCEPGFPGSNIKAKYPLPQAQLPYGHSHQGELSATSRSLEDAAKRGEVHPTDAKRYFPTHQGNDHKGSLSRHQDPWVPQEDHRISPLKTPLLHSLAQESRSLTARQQAAQLQEAGDSMAAGGGKCIRRSDRYATVLRNEIQQKRAQLQKSRSAATLTCEAEDEQAEEWRSTETSTSSGVTNTYKDHLKEAQARVLQATSFQRRDLEPLGPEGTLVKTSNGRIRGRKRFPLAKRMHSFSEPDQIDKLGVEGEAQTGSFGDRRKIFEAKPAFSRPVLKSNQGSILNTDLGEKQRPGESEDSHTSTDLENLSPGHTQVLLEQQRLGTFAEYQATWSKQKKSSEAKTQGRYHSAENILDTDVEEAPVCIHERSRSSPSADFYTQNIPSPWIDPPCQQSSSRGKTERYQPDRSPQSAASVPRIEGPVPGLADHRNKPDAANPSHTTLSSGPCSLIPAAQSPPTKGLLPPPRPHLGAETTSSSKEFLAPDPLQPVSSCSSDSQNSSAGSRTPRGGENEVEEEEEQPSSSSLRARSPSPHFAPLRLTDRPPAVLVQEDTALRSGNDLKLPIEMDVNSPVKKVPVRIVHSESESEREGQAYLPQSSDTCSDPAPVPESSSAGGQRSVEDAKREELARDIMGKDKSLADILDQSGRMTTMDLMEGLFPTEEQILEGGQQRRRAYSGSRLPTPSPRSMDRREEEDVSVSAAASLVPSSSYYNTSAPKAELLIKMKDMQEQLEEQDSEDELDVDLASKKQELISSLARKLEVLREARRSLQEDVEDNEALGREVQGTVQRLCQANQLDKFCMFVGDLDKVVSLLLSLSGRLARVENALNSLEEEAPPEEKRTLTRKRKLLMQQHEDAKELKENLDRRERVVSSIMEAHLDAENLDDYRHFVKMKSALIIEQRKLEDKIHLGEEQLKCLLDSLPLEQRPMF